MENGLRPHLVMIKESRIQMPVFKGISLHSINEAQYKEGPKIKVYIRFKVEMASIG